MNGLQVIVGSGIKSGTLHAIAEPPKREDYDSDEAYKDAYWRSVAWVVTVENIDE